MLGLSDRHQTDRTDMTLSANATQGATELRRIHKARPMLDLAALPDGALIVRSQVAAYVGYTEQALKKWAREGRGPKITKVEGRPRYRAADVREWLGLKAAA
jgi:hypothetical protein